jgi:hypothetical protein
MRIAVHHRYDWLSMLVYYVSTRLPRVTPVWPLFFKSKGHTMTAKLAETTIWQQNTASLIRSGLYSRAVTHERNGLHLVIGVYPDHSWSAPIAKFSDARRALDAANVVNRLANLRSPVEVN